MLRSEVIVKELLGPQDPFTFLRSIKPWKFQAYGSSLDSSLIIKEGVIMSPPDVVLTFLCQLAYLLRQCLDQLLSAVLAFSYLCCLLLLLVLDFSNCSYLFPATPDCLSILLCLPSTMLLAQKAE